MAAEKVSVITVCYNSEKMIEYTLKSVLLQTYRPLQHVIIDGQSEDQTLKIIDKFRVEYAKQDIDLLVISEQDTGIYNAMNKGCQVSDGEWLIFINSDDQFYSPTSLIDAFQKINPDKTDIIYGDECIYNRKGNAFINKRSSDISLIEKNLPFCHQSSLVRRKWLFKHPFDEDLLISSDYEFFLFCYFNNASFKYCDVVISSYFNNGISRREYKTAIDECFMIKIKYHIINPKRIDLRLKKELRKIYTAVCIRRNS